MIKFARTCVLLKPKIPYSPFNHKIIARFNVIITLIVIFIVSKMSKINSKKLPIRSQLFMTDSRSVKRT